MYMRKSINSILILLAMTLAATGVLAADNSDAPGVVNINTADASQIAFLPRVGPKTAERVIQFREEHGPFDRPTDLMQVKGIGDKTFELLSQYIVVEGNSTLASKQKTPRRVKETHEPANSAQ